MSSTQQKTVYGKTGTQTPFWYWVFQRLSGVLLGPLVAIHILWPRGAYITWASAALLALLLGHALVGVWRLAVRRGNSPALARGGVLASLAYVVFVGVLGTALVLSV